MTLELKNTTPLDFATHTHGSELPGSPQEIEGELVVTSHAHAHAVATDPDSFSSRVSRFMQLPNGLDGEEHTRFRALIDAYLSDSAVAGFAQAFERTAREVVGELQGRATIDAVSELGTPFAVRAMMAWLGWPEEMARRLVQWVADNNAATRSGELAQTAEVAERFDALIAEAIEATKGTDTVTAQLVQDVSLGRRLRFEEVVSILRNWTAGDLSSMAYCVGVIVDQLARNPQLAQRLRSGVSDAEFGAIADEMLRIDDPFVSNRRVTTCPVDIGGVAVPEGTRVRIHWTAANRDPQVFPDPAGFNPSENADKNLVWGAGPHKCPGRSLSMVELRALVDQLLARVELAHPGDGSAEREIHPVGGWSKRPITLIWR
ncbi:cytochrome P450 [Corynebacterium tapiri]|uniref:Cytochrome P450 n=1 Tax=Corynebacterium tapiri TaxID=1448266 RepID=A0A5C4U2E9_9CORY|nr:cytochrome P450 [Corynebacterium tapiri]TNL96112.1 cytochrome P450 [Corynebacterium tapiri]